MSFHLNFDSVLIEHLRYIVLLLRYENCDYKRNFYPSPTLRFSPSSPCNGIGNVHVHSLVIVIVHT